MDRGLVKAAGVLAEPVNESDHRSVMLNIDVVTALGKSRLHVGGHKAHKESDQSDMN